MLLLWHMAVLFLLTVLLVGAVKYYAQHFLLDSPNERSSHSVVTPRGGGLGCVLAYALVCGYYFSLQTWHGTQVALVSLGCAIAVLGFIDDHRHVAVRWRMLLHFGASLCAMPFLPQLSFLLPWGWLGSVFGVLFLVWCLNLFNFMDGIDGIAASEALFVSLALAGFVWQVDMVGAQLALALAMVNAGFLVWNWPPARIFMGDVGSGFIGFMLGVLIIRLSQGQFVLFTIGLILFAAFIVDASFTLLWRLLSGQKIYQAHCTHAYQRAAKCYGHRKVVLWLWLLNVGYLLPLAMVAFNHPDHTGWLFCAAYVPLLVLAFVLKAGQVGS